jgi:hypothetical protein
MCTKILTSLKIKLIALLSFLFFFKCLWVLGVITQKMGINTQRNFPFFRRNLAPKNPKHTLNP